MKKINLIVITLSLALFTACNNDKAVEEPTIATSAETNSGTNIITEKNPNESEKANALFEEIFMQGVMRSPMYQSMLGIKKDHDKWNDLSEEHALENHEINIADLIKVNMIDVTELDEQTKLSLRLQKLTLQKRIDDYKWRHHSYPVNQMRGVHASAPSLLINQHRITDIYDAEAYIARLNAIPQLFTQVIDGLNIREEKGIIAPKFVYPYVISDSQNIIKGSPFDDGPESTLMADFRSKVSKLAIDQSKKEELIEAATTALQTNVKLGYEALIEAVQKLALKADDRAGVWKFPDGKAFFANALARTTTTNLTSEEIHQIGLSEVDRIHNEMRTIMKKVNFEGDLKTFFKFMREDKQFYYSQDQMGRDRYLSEATALIDMMKTRLDELFIMKPKAKLQVKAVEAFREKSAGRAFYQRPSMDGTRPGIYYANLYRMADMSTYQMEALAYHEGIPGHHMQLAIAQELEGIPKFRKFGRYTAYTEGWGLYSEQLPKMIGFYQDPYSDFGRLAMELWRACRLVVDTGIHTMEWSREQGIDFYVNNAPNAKTSAIKMVERHIVMPSQATAYKIGMIKILELRHKAEQQLADKFDIREYHDVVLKNGPVPLNILEELVTQYISSKLD